MALEQLPRFLTTTEVANLVDYYSALPYSKEKYIDTHHGNLLQYRNKHSNYDQPDSLAHKILYDKISAHIGKHVMDSGALLESHYPFGLHADAANVFKTKEFYNHNDQSIDHSFLISLNGDDGMSTVFFDYFDDQYITQNLPECAEPVVWAHADQIDLSHLSVKELKFIEDKKLSAVYKWHPGDAVTWPRSQLHCASNFYGTGLIKQAITLFF